MFNASQQQIMILEKHTIFISRGEVYICKIGEHSPKIVHCLKNEYIIGTTDAFYNSILEAYILYFLTKNSKVLHCLYKPKNKLNLFTLKKSPQTSIIKNIAKIINAPFFWSRTLNKEK